MYICIHNLFVCVRVCWKEGFYLFTVDVREQQQIALEPFCLEDKTIVIGFQLKENETLIFSVIVLIKS